MNPAGAPLFDSHVHLDDPDVAEGAIAGRLVAEAAAAGVVGLFSAGYGPEREVDAARLPAASAPVWRAVGLHPWWLARARDDDAREAGLAWLRTVAIGPDVRAIGEIGLDATRRDVLGADAQRTWFERSLHIACERRLPVVLHVVRWHGHALASLGRVRTVGGVVHRFGGPPDVVHGYVRAGLHLSMATDWLRRPEKAAAVARAIPADRLVVETDWPLDDRPYAAAAAELAELVTQIARWRGEDEAELRAQLLANTLALYRIDAGAAQLMPAKAIVA